MIAFVNATLIDGTGAAPRKLQQVLVDGKKIVAIGRHLALPDDAILYDLHGKVLMPGIIDSHAHFGNGYRVGLAGPHETEEYKDMRNMCLAHGVTTIRSGADYMHQICGIRDRINEGKLRGPRFIVCGPHLMWAECHPSITAWGPMGGKNETRENCGVYPHSPQEARDCVKQVVDLGVDYVKIIISGENAFYDLGKGTPCIDDDIVEAIIDESHKLGKTVACHVETLEKAYMAAERGADELHHLVYTGTTPSKLEEYFPLFRLMCRNKIWLCPTLALLHRFEARLLRKTTLPVPASDLNNVFRGIEVFRSAYEFGVPIVMGTDCGAPLAPWGPVAHFEMQAYVDDIGMSPLEAIRSSTQCAAQACGIDDIVGTVQAEKLADLIVLDQDPSVDIHNSTSVKLVLREGKVEWGEGAQLTEDDMPSFREASFWAKNTVINL